MKNGTTSSGFAYEFDELKLDDMRFVDILAVVVDENASPLDKIVGASKLLSMMLGEAQKEALYKHIGERYDGRVPRAELEKALEEIMSGAGEEAEKNS